MDYIKSYVYTSVVQADLGLIVLTQKTASTLTPSPSYDCYEFTELEEALTIENPSPAYGNFEIFTVRLTDDGNAQDIIFGDKFRGQGLAIPATTTPGKTMIISCMYDSNTDKYDLRYSEEV